MTICVVKQMGLFYDVEKLFFFFFFFHKGKKSIRTITAAQVIY